MIKIKILKDGVRGADDGATVREYPKNGGPNKDGIYTVSAGLAEALIESEDAEEVVEKKPTVTERVKAKNSKNDAAEKEAADKAAAEKEAADKAAADAAKNETKLTGLPPIPGKK